IDTVMGNQWPAVRQADYGLGAVPWQLKLSQWFRGQESESLCGSAFVSMVKPAHLGHGNNPSPLGRFNRSAVRRFLPKRKMTTRTVIVVQVAGRLADVDKGQPTAVKGGNLIWVHR